MFDQGEVFGWRMNIQGSRERILDSVVPHEVTHTIFASHFRRPIPRWADEGACTTVEHRSEISKQENMLIDFLKTRRGIPFSQMFAMTEYPRDVLPLYAQGHSLSQFLIYQSGKKGFLEFLAHGMDNGDWQGALRQKYGYEDLLVLQNSWLDWIRQGRPKLQLASNAVQTASFEVPTKGKSQDWQSSGDIVRGQDPGPKPPVQLASASVYAASPTPSAAPRTQVANSPQVADVTPTPEQLWPAEQATQPVAPVASVYDASRGGAIRR